jgi:hypothetical protein
MDGMLGLLAMNVGHVMLVDGGLEDPMTLVGLLRSHNDSCNLSRRPKGHTTVSLRWELLSGAKNDRFITRISPSPTETFLDWRRHQCHSHSSKWLEHTFTFVWTLTIPFVSSGRNYFDIPSVVHIFVVLLTYSFLWAWTCKQDAQAIHSATR